MLDIHKYPLTSDQIDYGELKVIIHALEGVLNRGVAGSIVELGCYTGTTSLFMQRALNNHNQDREFHVYDSFAGLPAKTDQDRSPAGEQFRAGELTASKSVFINNFKHAGLPLPHIHKAWFDQLTDADLPPNIAFAFLDGDFYASIKTSLQLIEHKLSAGAVVIVDDYQSEALPGAARAVDEWLATRPQLRIQATQSLAVISGF